MAEWTEQEILDAVKKVSGQAAEDSKFHALALSNPAQAIKEATGKVVPDGIKVKFLALGDADFAFVLPNPQKDGELSDSDLESVAGGRCKLSSVSIGYCR
jgi:hypothetical protein